VWKTAADTAAAQKSLRTNLNVHLHAKLGHISLLQDLCSLVSPIAERRENAVIQHILIPNLTHTGLSLPKCLPVGRLLKCTVGYFCLREQPRVFLRANARKLVQFKGQEPVTAAWLYVQSSCEERVVFIVLYIDLLSFNIITKKCTPGSSLLFHTEGTPDTTMTVVVWSRLTWGYGWFQAGNLWRYLHYEYEKNHSQ